MHSEQELRVTRDARRNQSQLLMAWSIASMVAGLVLSGVAMWRLAGSGRIFTGAAGSQFFIWGAIDAIFAVGGVRQAIKADRTPINETVIRAELTDRDKLLGFLRFNAYLNYLWVGTGVLLLLAGFSMHRNPALLGHGIGVTIQGGFLFVIDWKFVRWLKAARG